MAALRQDAGAQPAAPGRTGNGRRRLRPGHVSLRNAAGKDHLECPLQSQLFWLPPDAEIDFDLFYSILHPDDREHRSAGPSRRASNRRASCTDIEYRTVSPLGQIRYVLRHRAHLLRRRRASRCVSTAPRRTSPNRNSRGFRLRDSEARFASWRTPCRRLSGRPGPMAYLISYNRRWYEFSRPTPRQMRRRRNGTSVHDPDECRGCWQVWTHRSPRASREATDFRVRRADGELPLVSRAGAGRSAMPPAQIVHWFGTYTDITETARLLGQNAAAARIRTRRPRGGRARQPHEG